MNKSKLIVAISLMILVSISGVLAVSSITGRAAQEQIGACRDTDGDDPNTAGVVIERVKGVERLSAKFNDKCVTRKGVTKLVEGVCVGRSGYGSTRDYKNLPAGRCVTESFEIELSNDKTGVITKQTVSAVKWVSDSCTANTDGSVVYQGVTNKPNCEGNNLVTYACKLDTTLKTVRTSCGSGQVCKDEDDGYGSAQCVSGTELRVQGEGQQSVPVLARRLNRLICKLGEEDDSYLELLAPGFDCGSV